MTRLLWNSYLLVPDYSYKYGISSDQIWRKPSILVRGSRPPKRESRGGRATSRCTADLVGPLWSEVASWVLRPDGTIMPPPSFTPMPALIIDTDLSIDVDDVGALCMAHALVDRGEASILAMVQDTGFDAPCVHLLFERPLKSMIFH